MTLAHCDIGFIGGGNMAEALIGGLLANGHDPGALVAADPSEERRDTLAARHGIQVTADNAALVAASDTCVLAVKPQRMAEVVQPLAERFRAHQPMIISVAAGITLDQIDQWSGGQCAIVRVMPNTPALVGHGASALCGNARVGQAQRQTADALLAAVGITSWLDDESLLDTVTALSGSGPAYFFLVMDALCRAAERHGLDADTARRLCTQTALGAAALAMQSEESLEQLRRNVTSPGGTTEQGVQALTAAGLEQAFADAIDAARRRSIELSQPEHR